MRALLQYITGGGAGSTSRAFAGRRGIVQKREVSWLTAGVRGDLATASREPRSEVELAFVFALGMGRRRAVLLVGVSSGVGRCELDCGRGVREDEIVARSVRTLRRGGCWTRWGMERVGTRTGMWGLDCSRRRGVSGGGRKGYMPRSGVGDPCVPAWIRRVGCHLFEAVGGRVSVRMPGIFCVCPGRTDGVSNGE